MKRATSSCWDELFFDRAQVPRPHICHSEASSLSFISFSQSSQKIQSSQELITKTSHDWMGCSMVLQLNEFDVTVLTPWGLQSPALTNL